jgi:hypothetical protein
MLAQYPENYVRWPSSQVGTGTASVSQEFFVLSPLQSLKNAENFCHISSFVPDMAASRVLFKTLAQFFFPTSHHLPTIYRKTAISPTG